VLQAKELQTIRAHKNALARARAASVRRIREAHRLSRGTRCAHATLPFITLVGNAFRISSAIGIERLADRRRTPKRLCSAKMGTAEMGTAESRHNLEGGQKLHSGGIVLCSTPAIGAHCPGP